MGLYNKYKLQVEFVQMLQMLDGMLTLYVQIFVRPCWRVSLPGGLAS